MLTNASFAIDTTRAASIGKAIANDCLMLVPTRPAPRPTIASVTPRLVTITPAENVVRRMVVGHGITAELIEAVGHERTEFRFKAPVHLLAVYEQGTRRDGETTAGDRARSSLRDLGRKLTFVPAGTEFREWHALRAPMRMLFLYIDAAAQPAPEAGQSPMAARVFFEDAALWATALKLKRLVEAPTPGNQLYFDALGQVLSLELQRVNRGAPRLDVQARGGLAAWQQRTVAAFIEEHLAEPITLATLAGLVRLSPYYFCRAFKQSFGLPPHRFLTQRRIERAKLLLAKRAASVTEIGLSVGFSESSSFATAFRKATGQTPSSYHRGLA
jgi:AraC family transcriptional regulator